MEVTVEDAHRLASEREELGRIDYFLEHLARAVERGEVHRASYDVLAPRYLARRADLVGILTGRPLPAAPEERTETAPPAAETPAGETPDVGALSDAAWQAAASHAPPAYVPPPRTPVKVNWTTVLLFLGAFLVISASAIFALTVWNSVGPLVKLGFLGAVTLGFYAAGYYARVKLKLMAGSTALTVVASAMLLFDCWIVIDSYHLAGPMPWAVALLIVSTVYWVTELATGQRIYGVSGAAAQVAWWWLAADGLHLDPIVRIAVIAVIGVSWQLLAERAVKEESLRSLSEVLLFAAPLVEVLAMFGALYAVFSGGGTDAPTIAAAAAVSGSGAVVVLRSELASRAGESWIAAALQLPLFAAIIVGKEPSWTGVAFLVALTAAYLLTALMRCGAPMTLTAAAAEVLAVSSALNLLQVREHGAAATAAVLGLSWIVAAFMLDRAAEHPLSPLLSGAEETGKTLRVVGLLLLALASFGAVTVGDGIALSGARIIAADVSVAAVVLAAWAAAALLPRRPVPAAGAIAWSFYALATLLAWAAPGWQSGAYASALLGLAAIWLFARGAMERFYRLDAEVVGWAMRTLMAVIVVGGLLAQIAFHNQASSWSTVLLAALAALVYLADAYFAEQTASAAAGAAALVLAGVLVGRLTWGGHGEGLVLSAAVGVLVAGVALLLKRAWPDHAPWLATSAAVAATLSCGLGGTQWWVAGALALASASWVLAAAVRWEPLALPAAVTGLASLAACLSAADRPGWVTVLAFVVAALALGSSAFLPWTRKDSRHTMTGVMLSFAGVLPLAWLVTIGQTGVPLYGGATGWLAIGQRGLVVALLALGAYGVAQARAWRIEPLVYLGCFAILLGEFVELGVMHYTTIELFSTSVALYLVAMGYLYRAWESPRRDVPLVVDVGAVLVGLGTPLFAALSNTIGRPMIVHTGWTIGLSLVAIAAGILLRSRWYLFGGTGALAVVAGWRTLGYLAELWWLVLGIIGIALLAVALTWERQRQFIGETRARLQDSFENWR